VIPNQFSGKDVRVIADNVFNNKGLVSITLPSTLTSIGNLAFANNQLTSLVIPSNVN